MTHQSPPNLETAPGPLRRFYRAQGRSSRPEAVDFLDAAGEVRLGYRIRYSADGRPVFEERIFYNKPKDYSLYQRSDRVEFTSAPGRTWEVVRIRIDLDQRGRPSKMEKYVGARLEYTVRREFDAAGLKTESFFDADDELKLRSVFRTENGRRFETMLNGAGKVLLQREVDPGAAIRSPEVLDSSTGYPVQTPIDTDETEKWWNSIAKEV